MADLSLKIKAELENIDIVINEIPFSSKLPYLSTLELSGVAALLHNFYNGIENVLKQILISLNTRIPEGKSWHRELIIRAETNGIISTELKNVLGEYLTFRHFFTHAYSFDLHSEKMEPLVENIKETYLNFKNEIRTYYE